MDIKRIKTDTDQHPSLSIESKYRSNKKLSINEQSLSPFYIISLSTREVIVEGFLQPRIG